MPPDDITQTATASGRTPKNSETPLGLVIVHHPEARFESCGRAIAPRGKIKIGRGGDELIPGALESSRISRNHCEIQRKGQVLSIVDLGSRNGTFVNGSPIRSTSEIRPGDVIEVGPMLLLLHRGPLPEASSTGNIIGVSSALKEVLAQVDLVAPRETSALILGETGVGKELIANRLHVASRRTGSFVALNCGSLSDSLLQSELFGHVKGAFSGAIRDRRGLVASAEKGTLFLDEIGDASPGLQRSLLRLLQEREYRVLGSETVRKADVRVVAATHRDLEESVTSDEFRQDLYARLARWVIRVPPLRNRREDILVLAAQFAAQHSGRPIRIATAFASALLRYDWPGNVRELEATMERAVVAFKGGETLDAPEWITREISPTLEEKTQSAVPRRAPQSRPSKEELTTVVLASKGNIRLVAESLDVGRGTLYRWFKDLDIDLAALRGYMEDG